MDLLIHIDQKELFATGEHLFVLPKTTNDYYSISRRLVANKVINWFQKFISQTMSQQQIIFIWSSNNNTTEIISVNRTKKIFLT